MIDRACRLLSLVALGLLAHSVAESAEQERLVTAGRFVPESYFGLHIHEAATTTPWPSVPFGAWRLWDAYVNWPQIEPGRGEYEFRRLDRYLALADEHRVAVLLPLGLSPRWASARPREPSAYGLGNAAEPANIDDWRGYVEAVVLRYRGRIEAYEIWNEPNLPRFFSGTPDQLLQLAREAFEVIKRVDPGAIVVSPSVTGGGEGVEWLDRYLALGGARYADVIGYHFYVSPEQPESALPVIRRVQAVMAGRGVKKPLWNTEAGWVIESREAVADPAAVGFGAETKPLPPELAAAYVARFLALVWAAGVERNYWYAWDNKAMGLVEPRSMVAKLAAQAYARTAEWLVGARIEECRSEPGGIWYCALEASTGVRARLVWRPAGPLRWAVPAVWRASDYQSLDGKVRPIESPGLIEIGTAPVLVRERRNGP